MQGRIPGGVRGKLPHDKLPHDKLPHDKLPHDKLAGDKAPRDKLLGIQAARGVAALLVVIYHAGRMIALPQYVGEIPLGNAFGFGHAGVDFFFVLSGFIIYFVHHADIGRPARMRIYAWRRVTRIYPIYWVVTALVVAVAVLSHGAEGWPDGAYLMKSLLLLPQDADPVVGVAWTLEHEMLFYTLFAFAVANRRLGIAVFAAWFGLIVLGLCAPGVLSAGPGSIETMPETDLILRFVAGPIHLDFFMGIAAAHLVLTRPRRPEFPPLVLAGIGIAAFFAVGLGENAALLPRAGLASLWMFGAASACILVGLAQAERAGTIRAGRATALFGAASYALYLIHTFIIGLSVHLMALAGLARMLPGAAVMAVVIVTALIGGVLLHLLIERPMMTLINRLPRQPVGFRGAKRLDLPEPPSI